jgi:hypothetical protein
MKTGTDLGISAVRVCKANRPISWRYLTRRRKRRRPRQSRPSQDSIKDRISDGLFVLGLVILIIGTQVVLLLSYFASGCVLQVVLGRVQLFAALFELRLPRSCRILLTYTGIRYSVIYEPIVRRSANPGIISR